MKANSAQTLWTITVVSVILAPFLGIVTGMLVGMLTGSPGLGLGLGVAIMGALFAFAASLHADDPERAVPPMAEVGMLLLIGLAIVAALVATYLLA